MSDRMKQAEQLIAELNLQDQKSLEELDKKKPQSDRPKEDRNKEACGPAHNTQSDEDVLIAYFNNLLYELYQNHDLKKEDVDNLLFIMYNKYIDNNSHLSVVLDSLLTSVLYNFILYKNQNIKHEQPRPVVEKQQVQEVSDKEAAEEFLLPQAEKGPSARLNVLLLPRLKNIYKVETTERSRH